MVMLKTEVVEEYQSLGSMSAQVLVERYLGQGGMVMAMVQSDVEEGYQS